MSQRFSDLFFVCVAAAAPISNPFPCDYSQAFSPQESHRNVCLGSETVNK